MGIKLREHPHIKIIILSICVFFGSSVFQSANAEVISIPLHREIATQPITKLEVIAIVKTLLNGRVLSVKKQSTYSNPDCHHVKFLEDRGEFQFIQLGCFEKNIAHSSP